MTKNEIKNRIDNINSIQEAIGAELADNPSVDWIPEFDELEREKEALIEAIQSVTGSTIPSDIREFVIERTIAKGGI